MSRKKATEQETIFKDVLGKEIKNNNFIADAQGNTYRVNLVTGLATPLNEGAVTRLQDLLDLGGVKVLSAQETLMLEADKAGIARVGSSKRAEASKTDAKPAEAPQHVRAGEAQNNAPAPDVMAEIALALQVIPDNLLAKELRRRGYVFCAVKPAIVEL